MKINELKELMTLIEQSPIDVLKLEIPHFKLYYQKNDAVNTFVHLEEQHAETIQSDAMNDIIAVSDQPTPKVNDGFQQIKSPMIGIFYARPNPDAQPFVQIGSLVEKDQPVCILEAMKLLNEVPSDVNGEIVDILVEDGDVIEFGQPLFVVKVNQ